MAPRRGFTLVEMVVTLVVLGILFVLSLPVLTSGLGAFDANRDSLATLTDLRYATERIARELREMCRNPASPDDFYITSPIASPSSSLVFYKREPDCTAPTQVSVAASGGSLTLAYGSVAGGAPFVLAPNLQGFAVNFLQGDGSAATSTADVALVEFSITLQNPAGSSYPQRTRVALRNRE